MLAIAARILPDILKVALGEKNAPVAEVVAKAVTDAAGTADPVQAKAKVEADPALEQNLKIKLAEIAAEEEEKRRQADLAARRLEIDDAAKKEAAQMEQLKAQFEQDDKRRQAQLDEFQARLNDMQGARDTFKSLALAGNPMSWGAPVVSVIITLGFFGTLTLLIAGKSVMDVKEPVLQIVNIIVGALAAGFATVVSFLGSSEGSRAKDATSFQLQSQQAQQTGDVVRAQASQTEAAIRTAGQAAAASPAAATKPEVASPGKASTFNRCMEVVFVQEGGFSDNPKDPGGATNLGITKATLEDWRGKPVTVDDVKNLTKDEAREIYRARYWNPLDCDALPGGVDLVVFDFGVNAGPSRSAKTLQKIVGVTQDGSIGPITIAAVGALAAADLIRTFSQRRLEFYRGLATWDTFGKGWTNRVNAVEKEALQMVASN